MKKYMAILLTISMIAYFMTFLAYAKEDILTVNINYVESRLEIRGTVSRNVLQSVTLRMLSPNTQISDIPTNKNAIFAIDSTIADNMGNFEFNIGLKNCNDLKLGTYKTLVSGNTFENLETTFTISADDIEKLYYSTLTMFANNSMAYLVNGKKFEKENVTKFADSTLYIDLQTAISSLGIAKIENNDTIKLEYNNRYLVFDKNTLSVVGSDGVLYNLKKYDNIYYISYNAFKELGITVNYSNKYNCVSYGDSQANDTSIAQLGIFVSTVGDDKNSGAVYEPVKTLNRAKEIANVQKNHPELSKYSTTIYIAQGDYLSSENSLKLTANDSGVSSQKPIIYKAMGEVNLKGSASISKNKFVLSQDVKIPFEVRGTKVYEADISDLGITTPYYSARGGSSYYEIYQNNKLCKIAKYPNNGYVKITGGISDSQFTYENDTVHTNRWARGDEKIFVGGYMGNNWSFFISGANVSGTKFTLNSQSYYGCKAGQRFFVFNTLRELDEQGEWYIDDVSQKLFYYPINDNLDNIEISTSTTPLISVSGGKNIIFDGIDVEKSRNNGYLIENSENITVTNSNICHLGKYGVEIKECTDVNVENSNIYDIADMPAYISGGDRYTLTPGNNMIYNCDVSDYGRCYKTYAGIMMYGCGNKIVNNEIHDAAHLAIRFQGNNHLISSNNIYNVANEADDSGAIYWGSDWAGFGNTVSNNYVHDLSSSMIIDPQTRNVTVSAIYADDQETGANIVDNVIENVPLALLIGGGKCLTIENNVAINTARGLLYDKRGTKEYLGETGNWYKTTLKGGTLNNNFRNIVENKNCDFEKWKTQYNDKNFLNHYNEVLAQTSNPKDNNIASVPNYSTFKNNTFASENISNKGFWEIPNSVKEVGTVKIVDKNQIDRTSLKLNEKGVVSRLFDESKHEEEPITNTITIGDIKFLDENDLPTTLKSDTIIKAKINIKNDTNNYYSTTTLYVSLVDENTHKSHCLSMQNSTLPSLCTQWSEITFKLPKDYDMVNQKLMLYVWENNENIKPITIALKIN